MTRESSVVSRIEPRRVANDSVAEMCIDVIDSYLEREEFELSRGTTALNVRHRGKL